MNLATEYLVRSGMAQESLHLPCAIFIFHYITHERVIVTVDNVEKFYKAKKWYVSKATIAEDMPPHDESTLIDKPALFESDLVVPEEYKLIPYHDCHYNQRSYIEPENVRQEAEFYNIHTQFANTMQHKKARRSWLWNAFCEIHGATAKAYPRRWQKWSQFFDIERSSGEIAPELSFAQVYEKKNGHYKEPQFIRASHEDALIRYSDYRHYQGIGEGQNFTYT